MRRRAFIALCLGTAASPLALRAQQPKVRRIGHLVAGSSSSPVSGAFRERLRQRLQDFGWVEGRDVVFAYRYAEGRLDRLPELAAELVGLKMDVIVASPTPAAVAARNATATIPIVMINAADPVGLGLVESLARPGGNVTGLAYSVGLETIGKSLELLKEAAPSIRRVAILSNPANPGNALAKQGLEVAVPSLALQPLFVEVRGPGDFDLAFAAMAKEGAAALLVIADVLTVEYRSRLAELAMQHRLPSMFGARENVEAGGLMSYGPSFPDQFQQAAAYVDQILKGASPAELPVKQPSQFEFVINLKVARALGIELPSTLLARADEVIE